MSLQFLVDGLLTGLMVGLGAIGVTLTYSILRFANFAHGELMTFGAYASWAMSFSIGALFGAWSGPIDPFSFGWSVLAAGALSMGLTAGLACLLDVVLFR